MMHRSRGLILLFAGLLVGTLLASLPAAGVETQPAPGALPEARFGYGAAVLDGTGYLAGGVTPQGFSSAILQVTSDGETAKVGDLPAGIKEPSVAAAGERVYVFGGAQQGAGDLPSSRNSIHRYSPASGQVQRVASLPYSIAQAPAVTVDGYVYIFGGLTIGGSVESPVVDYREGILRFDPGSEQVQQLATDLPTGRSQMAATVIDGTVYLAGGLGENDESGTTCPEPDDGACFLDEILAFTPDGNAGRLETIGHLPDRVRWATAATAEGHLYVLGGCRANCGPYHGLDRILEIDPATGQSTELPIRLPAKGGQRQALGLGQTVLLPGGQEPNPAYPEASTSPTRADDRIHQLGLGTTRPWAPHDLAVGPAREGGALLTWQAPAYDGGGDLLAYEIFRGAGANTPTRLAEVEATSPRFVDASARLGVTYTYQVRAVNQAGVSSFSNQAVITPTATPGTPELSAQGGDGKVVVQWSQPTDTGGLEVQAYRLYAYPAGTEVQVGDCPSNACWGELAGRYVVVNALGDGQALKNGQVYVFQVQARNGNGWGPVSEPVEATPSPVPDAPTALAAETGLVGGSRVVNLTWQASDSPDVTGYTIHRGPSLASLEPIGQVQGTSFADTGQLPSGEPITYAVAAVNGDKPGPLSRAVEVAFAQPPGNVTDLGARWTGAEVTVWWSAPQVTGGGEVVGYDVAVTRGAIDPETAGANITRVTTPPHSDPEPARGHTLVYHVRAVGTGGAGPWSTSQVRIPLTEDSRPPSPSLSVNPSDGQVGQPLLFDGSGSSDDEGVVAYHFEFGDGQSTGWTSSPRVEHVYTEEGVYEATLTVRDLKGLESETPAQVAIPIGPGPGQQDEAPEPTGPAEGNGTPLPAWLALIGLVVAAGVVRRRS